MTDTSFEPHAKLTRGMLVTVLYGLEDSSDMNGISGNPFTDVAAESWYGDAVYWASINGIIKGYSKEIFAPNDQITREQFAAIMERYATYEGNEVQNPSICHDLQIEEKFQIGQLRKSFLGSWLWFDFG